MVSVDAPELVAPSVWAVRIPLHVRVDPVNAYILRDDDGSITIFDTGVAPGATERWRAALQQIDAAPAHVQRIVVSHHHPDHIGGAGPLHRLTRAPLLASRSTIQQAPDVWGSGGRLESYMAAVHEHIAENGFPADVAAQLDHETALIRAAIDLPPDDAWEQLDDGDVIEAAGRSWRVRHTPGHADGHLVLHADDGLLLAGDHLLERISPAVGRFPRHEKDPLARYMESLMTIAIARPELVLPGHGAPFTGAADRARVLVAHHDERIDDCVAAVAAVPGGAATAYEVATRVFAHVFAADPPDAPNQRFATTETIAHLERARFDGRLTRAREADGLLRYRPA